MAYMIRPIPNDGSITDGTNSSTEKTFENKIEQNVLTFDWVSDLVEEQVAELQCRHLRGFDALLYAMPTS